MLRPSISADIRRSSTNWSKAARGFTTQTVRYLIALTDPKTGTCQGAVLCPGRRLAEHFVYVAEKSFKCQRAIPMAFFDRFEGRAVFNPPYP